MIQIYGLNADSYQTKPFVFYTLHLTLINTQQALYSTVRRLTTMTNVLN